MAFPAPGFPPPPRVAGAGAVTSLRIVERGDLCDTPRSESKVLYRQRRPPNLTVSWHPESGCQLQHDFFGLFVVSADGTDVACAPRELPEWVWQRFLVGQVLPLVAAVRGIEPLHGSAVKVGGRAVLCIGPSEAGKTSVALHLVQRGAGLVADDVAAVSVEHDGPVVHPGPALMSAAPEELASVGHAGPLRRWTRLGTLEGEVRLAGPEVPAGPEAIAAIFVLSRHAEGPVVTLQPYDQPLGKVLLGATFNAYYREPRRLLRQLDISGALAGAVPVLSLTSGLGGSAAISAAAVERFLAESA